MIPLVSIREFRTHRYVSTTFEDRAFAECIRLHEADDRLSFYYEKEK